MPIHWAFAAVYSPWVVRGRSAFASFGCDGARALLRGWREYAVDVVVQLRRIEAIEHNDVME